MRKYLEQKTIGIYILFFVMILITIQQIWFKNLFDSTNFLNWDAEHYSYISKNGYAGFRIAFFPLFPLIWKFLSVGVFGIILINSVLFLSSFYILIKILKITSATEILLYLSIPSFIFFYLPYTESLFFLCSVLIIIGLKNNRANLIYIGLFFAVLSRPAFTIFIPALIITELFNKNPEKKYFRINMCILITLLGLILVGIIQYIDTGEWFQLFSIQKEWGNRLQIPQLPLTSWAGGFIVRTDGFAFLIGVLAGGYLTAFIFNFKKLKKKIISKEVVFSLAYLAGITLSVLLFRGGSLFSLNRFVFATPFIIVALNYWIKQALNFNLKQLLLIFGLLFLFCMLFGSYVHILAILKFTLWSLYVILLFTLKSNKPFIQKASFILLISLNFTFQIIFYLRFLSGEWVG
jgi:hypothetical protein